MSWARPPKIFYVGAFLFPDGDAGARRVYGIGQALRDAGYEVVFLGAEQTGRHQDAVPGRGYVYDTFSYHPAGNAGSSALRRGIRLWHTHFSGRSTMVRLKTLWTDDTVAVIAYQASSALLAQLRRFCNRRHAALVTDVVEWYDRSHILWGRLGPFALDSELRMRHFNRRADGVVGISSYLVTYYARLGLPTVRVPVLVDTQATCWRLSATHRPSGLGVRVVFVGTAGKKDLVVNAIRGLALLGDEAESVHLAIVGPTRSAVASLLGKDAALLDRLRGKLDFLGRVSHAEALAQLVQADFSILLRPCQRFAHAGFPTKLVESLAMGVPVICNLTGDIGLYVVDGNEGVVVPDCSPEAFAGGMRRAIALSVEQRLIMRACARRRAEHDFEYRNWSESLGRFMRQILHDRKVAK